jgi:Spy/CpxP family protein refolding chaperone
MKKMVLSLAVAIVTTMGALAQETAQQGQQQQRRQMNPEEMVQRRTDATVKKYQLNEEQAQKLLELNKKYASQMPGMRRGGPRGNGGRGQQGAREGRRSHGERPSAMVQRPDSLHQGRPQMQPNEEMRKAMEAYDTELQQIMTPEQYKAYKADMEKRHQRGGQRGGQRDGRRPQQQTSE